MFKKICVAFLAVAIAAAMVMGSSVSYPDTNDNISLCDLDFKEVLN